MRYNRLDALQEFHVAIPTLKHQHTLYAFRFQRNNHLLHTKYHQENYMKTEERWKSCKKNNVKENLGTTNNNAIKIYLNNVKHSNSQMKRVHVQFERETDYLVRIGTYIHTHEHTYTHLPTLE